MYCERFTSYPKPLRQLVQRKYDSYNNILVLQLQWLAATSGKIHLRRVERVTHPINGSVNPLHALSRVLTLLLLLLLRLLLHQQ
jgi:hypothetical protein